jgi:pyruvate dehydrogenase E1 component
MFGFQRIGDLIWAAGDVRAKGFMLGATAGRTTLNGEGLQHEDGHSQILAATVPAIRAYDPAFAYEVAVIIQEGLKRMYADGEEVIYYLTLYNENYGMPAMPDGVQEGILKGLYKFRKSTLESKLKAQLFGSGPILREALRAQQILGEKFGVAADVWSATSYKQLRTDALKTKRWNMLHPNEEPRKPFIEQLLENEEGVFVAVSDYMKMVPDQIAPWVPGGMISLGTDGFGRSDTRTALRRFFEIDAECVAVAALYALAEQGHIKMRTVERAIKELQVDPEKLHPIIL